MILIPNRDESGRRIHSDGEKRPDLSILIAIDVDAPEDGQGCQLIFFVAAGLGRVLGAKDSLVLVKDAALFDGTAQVEDGRATMLETLDGGAGGVAVQARHQQRLFQGDVNVHQRAVHHLKDLFKMLKLAQLT